MSSSRGGRVVVATSGSVSSQSAINYAAHQAQARGSSLEIVHVVPPPVTAGPYGVAPDVAVRQAGRELLDRAEQVVRRTAPQVKVTTMLLTGERPDAIVHHAEDAQLLVVGAPPHDLIGRLWTGSTVTGTAARSACPVAIVPVWKSPAPTRQVVVGLKSTRNADRLLSSAFAVASQTGSALRIVHAWHLASPYDDAIAHRLSTPEWEVEEQRVIDGLLIDLRMIYPDVHVTIDLVHRQPAFTLVEATRSADLLVISRPAHGGFVHYLGATARAVIREAACPVLVVPPLDEAREAEQVGARTALAT